MLENESDGKPVLFKTKVSLKKRENGQPESVAEEKNTYDTLDPVTIIIPTPFYRARSRVNLDQQIRLIKKEDFKTVADLKRYETATT